MKDFQLRAWVVVKISKFICELHTHVSLIPLNLLDLKISRHFSHQPRIKKKNQVGPYVLVFVSPALRRQHFFVLRCDWPIKLSASCDVLISLLDV